PRIISLSELPEFATEQKNPGNKKHVTRIFVKLPSDRLDVAAERIATALIESGNADVSSIFTETLKSLIAEPVAATLRSIEQTRPELAKGAETAASAAGSTIPDELPKPSGMPTLDVNEISEKMIIEKPRMLSLFGKSAVASQVRRKLESEYDRAL